CCMPDAAEDDQTYELRLDFFWRCFPNGRDLYDPVTMNSACTGEKTVIDEGHKSYQVDTPHVLFLLYSSSSSITEFVQYQFYDKHFRCLCSLSKVVGKGASVVEDLIQLFLKRLQSIGLDNKQLYDPVTMNSACTGEKTVIDEGHKSYQVDTPHVLFLLYSSSSSITEFVQYQFYDKHFSFKQIWNIILFPFKNLKDPILERPSQMHLEDVLFLLERSIFKQLLGIGHFAGYCSSE
ncbi:hypothetical protein FRX31_033882, partial [Thalictrum thalictroides]